MEDNEIDCEYTDEVTCPYCGHVHGDSWEIGGRHDSFEYQCHECEKDFDCYRNVEVTYTSVAKKTPLQVDGTSPSAALAQKA